MKKVFGGSVLVLISLLITGCGGEGGGSSPTSPAPVAPVLRNVDGAVGAFGSNYHPFNLNVGGSVTISLNWGSSVDLDLYVTQVGCESLYPRAGCPAINQSNGFGKPETVTMNLGAGQYKVWVDNMSLSSGTSYTLTVTMPSGNVTTTAVTVPKQ